MAMTCDEKLKVARLGLLLNQSFFGEVAARLKLIEHTSPANPTLATDGKHLYYNRNFVNALTPEQVKFGICHEVLHCAFEHFYRIESRKPDVWNRATDYAINQILIRDKIGELIKAIPSLNFAGILHDDKYKGMSAEEIYDKLMKEGGGKGESFDVHIYVSPGKGDKDDKQKGKTPGKGKGDGDGDGEGGDGPGDLPTVSASQAKDYRDEFRDAVLDAVKNQMGGESRGSVPAEIARMAKQFLEPRISWRELLMNTIQSHVKSDVSFMRVSRKSMNCCAILPGRMPEETIRVACAIDVSGSISQAQVDDFLSEIKGIMTQYPSFEVYVWSFDTRCNALAKFTEDNADELDEWEPIGGGGTTIAENWNFMQKQQIEADTLIVFTDLCDSSQNTVDPNFIETVWVINNPYDKDIQPPFGTAARYD